MNKTLLTVLTGALLSFGLLFMPVHARELGNGEWYVRLTAMAGNLKDSSNVLGQLSDSLRGYDLHDLRELSPFATPYLTIVFPHPDWEEHAGDYGTDFHGTNKRNDKWIFDVRSDDINREVTLSWSIQPNLSGMWLVDTVAGTKVAAQDAGQQYTFNMDGQTVRRFKWVVNSNRRQKESR
jgi:hypothetical protein